MNIAVCVDSLACGGAEVLAVGLAREYARVGHTVSVFVYTIRDDFGRGLCRCLERAGVEVVDFDRRHPWQLIAYPLVLTREFRRRHIQVVHSHLEQMDTFVALVRMFCPGLRIFRTLHNTEPLGIYPRLIHKLLFRAFRGGNFLCSDGVRTGYRWPELTCGLPVVWNGVDVPEMDDDLRAGMRRDMRCRLGISEDEVVFVQTGRMQPNFGILCKGHDLTFAAAAMLPDRRFRIVFLGEDSARHDPQLYDQSVVDDQRFIFCGVVSDPVPYFAAADAMLFPSRVEGFGLAAMEGCLSGLPLICSDIEVLGIFDCEATLRFPSGDAAALTAAMERMLDTLPAMTAAAHAAIPRYRPYTLAATASRYLKAFEARNS